MKTDNPQGRAMRNNNPTGGRKSFLANHAVRVFIFIGLIAAPVVLIMMIFSPLAQKKNNAPSLEPFRLPANYQQEDIINIIKHFRGHPDFQFYYNALAEEQVENATVEIVFILLKAKSAEALLDEITKMKNDVFLAGIMFNSVQYDDDFMEYPDDSPELRGVMWRFLYEEFKLTMLGMCYKATYDSQFSFQWPQETRLAAAKLKSMVYAIRQYHKDREWSGLAP